MSRPGSLCACITTGERAEPIRNSTNEVFVSSVEGYGYNRHNIITILAFASPSQHEERSRKRARSLHQSLRFVHVLLPWFAETSVAETESVNLSERTLTVSFVARVIPELHSRLNNSPESKKNLPFHWINCE